MEEKLDEFFNKFSSEESPKFESFHIRDKFVNSNENSISRKTNFFLITNYLLKDSKNNTNNEFQKLSNNSRLENCNYFIGY